MTALGMMPLVLVVMRLTVRWLLVMLLLLRDAASGIRCPI